MNEPMNEPTNDPMGDPMHDAVDVSLTIAEIEAHLAVIEARSFADSGEWDAAFERLATAFDELPHPAIGHHLAVRVAHLAIEARRPDVARSAALTALALDGDDTDRTVDALLPLAYSLSDLGEHDAALELYAAVRTCLVEWGEVVGVAHVDMNIAIVFTGQLRHAEAVELLERSAAIFEDHGEDGERDACHLNLITALRDTKRFDEAATIAAALVERSRAASDRRRLADVLVNGANLAQETDRWEDAREALIEAMEIYRKLKLPTEQADCLDALGVVGRHDGLLDYAAAMHTEAIRMYDGTHLHADRATARYNLAVTQLHMRRFADARANASAAAGIVGAPLVIAAANEALGDAAQAARLRTEFVVRHGEELFDDVTRGLR